MLTWDKEKHRAEMSGVEGGIPEIAVENAPCVSKLVDLKQGEGAEQTASSVGSPLAAADPIVCPEAVDANPDPNKALVASAITVTGDAQPQQSLETPSVAPVEIPWTEKCHPVKRLPNCKITGIDYQATLADILSSFKPHEIQNIAVAKNTSNIEWDYNIQSHVISCKPTEAGDFELELCVDVQRHERHVFPLRLTVNPDPKTLWKNLPSDQNGIYAKPDCDKAFQACGADLSIVAASQRGRSHGQDAKPRDDDFAYSYDPVRACAVLVVADGAGSAKFSRKGSQIAVRTALDHVKQATGNNYWGELETTILKWKTDRDAAAEKNIQNSLYKVLIHAAFEAKQKIAQEAKEHEARYQADYKKSEKFSSRDYATTLIVTLAKKFEFGWFVATYWVGDGGVGIYQPDENKVILHGIPDSGDYGGQTCFLTMDSVWPNDANVLIQRRVRFDVVDSFKAIVLMTDGVTDPKFETENNLNSVTHWNDLWADLAKTVPWEKRDSTVADSLLAWMDFWSSGNHDDRTMMVLY